MGIVGKIFVSVVWGDNKKDTPESGDKRHYRSKAPYQNNTISNAHIERIPFDS